MKYEQLLEKVSVNALVSPNALRSIVEFHKPYDSEDTPHKIAIGWCKGCSIEYSISEYASQPYPCPTIKIIEKELING